MGKYYIYLSQILFDVPAKDYKYGIIGNQHLSLSLKW